MPYRKEWSSKENAFVWKFRVKFEGKEKKATIPFTGQNDLELKTIEIGLINSIKSAEESTKKNCSLKITFGMYIERYQESTGKHARTSIVEDIKDELGSIAIKYKDDYLDFEPVERAFDKFIEKQSTRKVMRKTAKYGERYGVGHYANKLVKVQIGTEMVASDKTISESHIQGYKRYFRCICSHGGKLKLSDPLPRIPQEWSPAGSVEVGGPVERVRPILEWERRAYFEAIERLPKLHWMLPVAKFSITMPIRPNDLCNLTVDAISEVHGQLKYKPQKTFSEKSKVYAYPAILSHMKPFILSRIKDTTCSAIFFKPGYEKAGENPKKNYPVKYDQLNKAHRKICEEAGIKDLRFYDFKHDAVNWLVNAGFDNNMIKQFAGWASTDMIKVYDTKDRERLAKGTQDVLENTKQSLLQEMGT